jgi:NAD(P)-dependent dehydrogenase (short-subunit alcohol dehydrogenase family)
MSQSSFATDANIVIAGASGGIGTELMRYYSADERVNRVFALQRTGSPNADGKIEALPFDLIDEESIRSAANVVGRHGSVDVVIVATGFLHDEHTVPEKSIQAIDADAMQNSFRINAIGPILLAKHFLPLMRKDAKTCFAAISARVGSISDNRLGGWASYRASKAALNMLLKTAAIEQRRRQPNSIIVALHPGTVDTPLSEPFQGSVPDGKLFTPSFAAERMIEVIDNLDTEDSGGFFAWNGEPIDF